MLNVVKMPLKGEVGGHALNSHGNYFIDHGKSWKNHGIVFLNFCWNPDSADAMRFLYLLHRLSGSIFGFKTMYQKLQWSNAVVFKFAVIIPRFEKGGGDI